MLYSYVAQSKTKYLHIPRDCCLSHKNLLPPNSTSITRNLSTPSSIQSNFNLLHPLNSSCARTSTLYLLANTFTSLNYAQKQLKSHLNNLSAQANLNKTQSNPLTTPLKSNNFVLTHGVKSEVEIPVIMHHTNFLSKYSTTSFLTCKLGVLKIRGNCKARYALPHTENLTLTPIPNPSKTLDNLHNYPKREFFSKTNRYGIGSAFFTVPTPSKPYKQTTRGMFDSYSGTKQKTQSNTFNTNKQHIYKQLRHIKINSFVPSYTRWKNMTSKLSPLQRVHLRQIIHSKLPVEKLVGRGRLLTSRFRQLFSDRKPTRKLRQNIIHKSKQAGHGLKELWKKYGYIGVATYFGVYLCSLSLVFVCLSQGLFTADDITYLLEKYDLNEWVDFKHVEKVDTVEGRFFLAWIVCKIIEPVRFVVTLALVPSMARIWWAYKKKIR